MDISIIIPLYNEEESLPKLFQWIERVMTTNNYTWEAIFVDDGSTDDSWNVILGLKKEHPQNVRAIKFRHNYGKSPALFCGFHALERFSPAISSIRCFLLSGNKHISRMDRPADHRSGRRRAQRKRSSGCIRAKMWRKAKRRNGQAQCGAKRKRAGRGGGVDTVRCGTT